MLGDNAKAIEFLLQVYPEGPWALTCIQPDRKGIETKTFVPARLEELDAWLKRWNGNRNLYWSVNPPINEVSKKTERTDIKAVHYLHVDVDPRVGEPLEDEHARILKLFTDKLPRGVPKPSVVIFSGGGFQGFWKLETPIPIDGDLAKAEDAKRYNQQLELLFAADQCHDISRIMRLPYSINIPDERKIKKGRKPTLAEVIEMDLTRVYPITSFTAAPVVQMKELGGIAGSSGGTVHVAGGNLEKLASIDELNQWNVPDRVKVICVQGRDPDNPKAGDNSRSMWVFDALCNLVRCEVPDQVIFSILMDSGFGISESVLEKGSNAEKYAVRQIERAKEHAVNPWLRQLNEEHAVIGNIGGRCRVIEEVYDASLRRSRLTRQSFDDFRNRYMHLKTQVGVDDNNKPIMVPVGKFWLGHERRRQFKTIVFAPGQEVKDVYNLWRGFGCEARPGDCSGFVEHIRANVCSGREELCEYVLGWMARLVQRPDTPGQVAIVLRGGRGVGKSFFAKELGHLLGRHFLHISNPSHLVGNFNSHLRDVVLLFADEAFYAGDKKHESILKTLITEETITIEAKGIDAEAAPNYVHLIMASNGMHVVPAGGDERRFLVLDVGAEHQQQSDYFGAIHKQMVEGGYEALLHFLLSYDLSKFDVRKVPQTDALNEQKQFSLGTHEDWWYKKLLEGALLNRGDDWPLEVRIDELNDDYLDYARRLNVSRRGSLTELGKFLKKAMGGGELQRVRRLVEYTEPGRDGFGYTVKKRAWFYRVPSVGESRGAWDVLHGRQAWPDLGTQDELPELRDAEPF